MAGYPAPTGVMISKENVYKYDSNGNLMWVFDTGSRARGVAVDAFDNVYVASLIGTEGYSVWKLTSDGIFVWGYVTGTHAFGIDIDSLGNVWVVGTRAGGEAPKSVWKLDNNGNFLWSFDTGANVLGVAIDDSNLVYVAGAKGNDNKTVWAMGGGSCEIGFAAYNVIFDNLGNYFVSGTTMEGKIVPAKFAVGSCNATWGQEMAFSWGMAYRAGYLYVAGGTAVGNLQKLDASNGNIIWDYKVGDFGVTYDIAIDSSGYLYVVGSFNRLHSFTKLDTDHNVIWGRKPGWATVMGVCVDSEDNIIVVSQRG